MRLTHERSFRGFPVTMRGTSHDNLWRYAGIIGRQAARRGPNLIGRDNQIFGDAGQTITDSARGGNDVLIGVDNSSSNQLFGDATNISGKAIGGKDALFGGNATAITSVTNFRAGPWRGSRCGRVRGSSMNFGAAARQFDGRHVALMLHGVAESGRQPLKLLVIIWCDMIRS